MRTSGVWVEHGLLSFRRKARICPRSLGRGPPGQSRGRAALKPQACRIHLLAPSPNCIPFPSPSAKGFTETIMKEWTSTVTERLRRSLRNPRPTGAMRSNVQLELQLLEDRSVPSTITSRPANIEATSTPSSSQPPYQMVTISGASGYQAPAELFAVTQNHALYEYQYAAGWSQIGSPGTVASVSAVLDEDGFTVAFVVTSDHAL